MTSVVLELLYANQDQLVGYLGIPGSERARYIESATGDSQSGRALKQQQLTDLLEARLNDHAVDPVRELQVELLGGRLEVGQVVSIDQDFYFRRNSDNQSIQMHARLNTDRAVKLEALLSSTRFPFASTSQHLSGRSRVFCVATVTAMEPDLVRLRPQFIGCRSWGSRVPGTTGGNEITREVHPQSIDQFAMVDWGTAATRPQLRAIACMLESDVKRHFSEILGHPFDEHDWGGERADLNIDNVLVRGAQTSSAWLLKGRSVQRTMQIADLGANGDQIERLTTTPAELLVVQHNQLISAAVKNMLAAFAYDMRNPRRYMLVDGNLTAMIFRDCDRI
jgi:hypothetical protein